MVIDARGIIQGEKPHGRAGSVSGLVLPPTEVENANAMAGNIIVERESKEPRL